MGNDKLRDKLKVCCVQGIVKGCGTLGLTGAQAILKVLFAPDLWQAQTFINIRQLYFGEFLASFIRTYGMFFSSGGEQLFLEKYWLESVVSKNPRMHIGPPYVGVHIEVLVMGMHVGPTI